MHFFKTFFSVGFVKYCDNSPKKQTKAKMGNYAQKFTKFCMKTCNTKTKSILLKPSAEKKFVFYPKKILLVFVEIKLKVDKSNIKKDNFKTSLKFP